MKLFLWPRYNDDAPVMFAMAETVEQARQLIMDEYEWTKDNAPVTDYFDAQQLRDIGTLNQSEPNVFDTPTGFFLVM